VRVVGSFASARLYRRRGRASSRPSTSSTARWTVKIWMPGHNGPHLDGKSRAELPGTAKKRKLRFIFPLDVFPKIAIGLDQVLSGCRRHDKTRFSGSNIRYCGSK